MKMFRTSNIEIVSLTLVLRCQVSCGQIVLKGLMLNNASCGGSFVNCGTNATQFLMLFSVVFTFVYYVWQQMLDI